MIEFVWEMFKFGLCLSECIIFYIFLERGCSKRISKIWLQTFGMICFSTIMYIMGLTNLTYLQNILICTGLLYFEGRLLFRVHWNKCMIYVGLFVIGACCIDAVIVGGISFIMFYYSNEAFIASNSIRILLAIVSKLCLLCFVWNWGKIDKEGIDEFPKAVTYLLMSMFAISLMNMFALIGTDQELIRKEGRLLDLFICLTAMSLFAANIIIYWIIKKLNINLKKEKDYALIQYQNELLSKVVMQNKQLEQEWRKIRHDFNNHISCIDMLLQMKNIEKARLYIKNMNSRCQSQYAGIRVGNEIADAVINQKYIVAQNNHIDFKVEGSMEEEITLEQMDLCALLSNSLDNAIEAALQIPDEAKRYIALDIKSYKQNVLFEIRNSVKENLKTTEELATTKVDKKRHGIGMMSMRTTVQKYDGNLWWKCENNQFLLSIMVKNR